MKSEGYIILTFEFGKEGRRWTAYCRELGTATFGRSLKEAESRLEEAVTLHLSTLEEVGEKERFFEEHSIEFYTVKPELDVSITLPVSTATYTRPYVQPVHDLSPAHA